MKIAGHLSAWGKQFEIGLSELSTMGFGHIEVGSNFITSFESAKNKYIEIMQKFRLEISAVFEVGHFNQWRRRREVYFHHDRIGRLLRDFGIKEVVIGPGIRMNVVDRRVYYSQMITMINEIASRYRHNDVVMGIHPHFGSSIFTEKEIDEVFDSIAEDIKLVVDIGHLSEAQVSLLQFIDKYKSRISNFHMKDVLTNIKGMQDHSNGGSVRCFNFCRIGSGELDYAGIINLLALNDYAGWVTIEMENHATKLYQTMSGSKTYLEQIIQNQHLLKRSDTV
ncbi:sugar phosphate isomerase/epimerase [Paenibacillus cellulosilyticus]|uniref:Sugar phosphate isomerase/epimerase n=2 Tax=Paenibacillus cellulosilyticus TaxID=375489 RepID=A0A2V2YTX0_9BACL|nr:sugar phosphate isomerase/epimerase [Paenibacillus cellulosilyticus]QKS43682.1 sugar phosphate isomerase/epimerase [Paenibacillus cellulosilyticus]